MAGFRLGTPNIRDAEYLSSLILRSKSHWGYSDEFMALCVESLKVTKEKLQKPGYLVAYEDGTGTPLGISRLVYEGDLAILDKLFIDPNAMGRGVGAALFERAIMDARGSGALRMTILADPQAEPFYLKMGAERLRMEPSDSIPGRFLPLLAYRL